MTFPATLPGAALAGKAATGVALAMLAVGGAGAVTIAATAAAGHAHVSAPATQSTTSTTPSNPTSNNGTETAFGQQVKAQVATCKSSLTSGQHGIGNCVSTWVLAHNPSNTRPNSHSTGAPVSRTGR